MLSELILENFKGFGDRHVIKLAPITLFYGTNSSGKSAILKCLGAIAQANPSAPSRLNQVTSFNFIGQPINLGGFENTVFKHEVDRKIIIGLKSRFELMRISFLPKGLIQELFYLVSFKYNQENYDSFVDEVTLKIILSDSDEIELNFKRRNSHESVTVGESKNEILYLHLNDEDFRSMANYMQTLSAHFLSNWSESSEKKLPHNLDEYEVYQEILELSTEAIATHLSQIHNIMDTSIRMNGFLFELNANENKRLGLSGLNAILYRMFFSILASFFNSMRREIAHIQYIGPMRTMPDRIETDINTSFSKLSYDGSDITSRLLSKNLLDKVNLELERLQIPYEIKIAKTGTIAEFPSIGRYRSLVFLDKKTNTALSAQDLGFGISQILPVIASCFDPSRTNILIEQPELHIHPKLQLDMAELFARTIKSEIPRQIFLETHSENIILRLQKLVRQSVLSSEEIAINFVQSGDQIGSWITPIPLLPNGELAEEWPGGFFTERLNEW